MKFPFAESSAGRPTAPRAPRRTFAKYHGKLTKPLKNMEISKMNISETSLPRIEQINNPILYRDTFEPPKNIHLTDKRFP